MVLIVLNQLILRCHAGLNMVKGLSNATAGKNALNRSNWPCSFVDVFFINNSISLFIAVLTW